MDTIKGYLLGAYWRRTFFSTKTVTVLLSAIGFFWLTTEICAFIVDAWKLELQAAWPYFLAASAGYTLWQRRPVVACCERLNGTDIWIEIRIADIFSLKAAYVISANTSFDTVINEKLISKNSLQGAFTEMHYDRIQHLDADLTSALRHQKPLRERPSKVGGKSKIYPIGSVALLSPNGQTAYFLAISELNEFGVAESSFEAVKTALASLWNFVSVRGSYEPLAIPILGTGRGRLTTPRAAVIKEIIRSFIAACAERKFANKLTVVISPKDYHENGLNIYDLGEFLRYACRYTEVTPSHRRAGTAIG